MSHYQTALTILANQLQTYVNEEMALDIVAVIASALVDYFCAIYHVNTEPIILYLKQKVSGLPDDF